MNTPKKRKAIDWAVFIFLLVIPYVEMAGAEKAVAWIVDGDTGCKVTRLEKGKFKEYDSKPGMALFPGDSIFKKDNIKSVLFDYLPYFKPIIKDNSTAIISTNAPGDKKTIFAKFADWLGLVKTKYKDARGTSRGAFGHEDVSLENATLLSGQTIEWDDYYKEKTLVFKQPDGKEVFRKTFKADLELIPGKAGLEPDHIYIREVKQGEILDFRSTIRVLGTEDENTVNQALASIDREKISAEEKILKKAAYLQFISDLYPGQVDLYWLSYQWLNKTEIKEEHLLALHEILLGCCLDHKTGGIAAVDFALLENQPGCLVTVELTRDDKTNFVAPDFPFTDYDEFSLQFQVNFLGYLAVVHEGTQTTLAFPTDSTRYRVNPGVTYSSCPYRFDDKPGIENYIFIFSDKPLEEIEKYGKMAAVPTNLKSQDDIIKRYGKLPGIRDARNLPAEVIARYMKVAGGPVCVDPTPGQGQLLLALISRVKGQEPEITLEMMGSKSFARITGPSVKGITWFRVSLEN